jgi:hypothetical protein
MADNSGPRLARDTFDAEVITHRHRCQPDEGPTMPDSPAARRRTVVAGAALALVIAASPLDQARAQAKLEASYTISVARIPIGNVTAGVEIGEAAAPPASCGCSRAAKVP